MSEQDLTQRLEQQIKSSKAWSKALFSIILVNIAVILGGVWWASNIDSRVSSIEKDEIEIMDSMIDKTSWKYNDYFTRYLWAERWGQTLPEPLHPTRSGSPNL